MWETSPEKTRPAQTSRPKGRQSGNGEPFPAASLNDAGAAPRPYAGTLHVLIVEVSVIWCVSRGHYAQQNISAALPLLCNRGVWQSFVSVPADVVSSACETAQHGSNRMQRERGLCMAATGTSTLQGARRKRSTAASGQTPPLTATLAQAQSGTLQLMLLRQQIPHLAPFEWIQAARTHAPHTVRLAVPVTYTTHGAGISSGLINSSTTPNRAHITTHLPSTLFQGCTPRLSAQGSGEFTMQTRESSTQPCMLLDMAQSPRTTSHAYDKIILRRAICRFHTQHASMIPCKLRSHAGGLGQKGQWLLVGLGTLYSIHIARTEQIMSPSCLTAGTLTAWQSGSCTSCRGSTPPTRCKASWGGCTSSRLRRRSGRESHGRPCPWWRASRSSRSGIAHYRPACQHCQGCCGKRASLIRCVPPAGGGFEALFVTAMHACFV